MPRAGLSAAAVVERAAQMLDEPHSEGLNLAAIADSFGVRVPSLYKHVDGVAGLQRGVTLHAKRSLTRVIAQAAIGRSRDDAIINIAHAYRGWALEHRGLYPLAMLPVDSGDPEEVEVAASFLDVMTGVLTGYQLSGDDAIDAIRFLRAALHGFVSLETSGGYEMPRDLDRSFNRLVGSITTALDGWARS
ncbi:MULTISPECIES: TetR-like C-terminal domain-containing protein [unclassified Arthrobacter]|uniref:TetR/AcrR family transcriptional regulator n=1 Tax=unclassified Arthrobacter TaxID=235627 RepID=UPI001E652CBF|nr:MULTISPECIES: TetR-like C-terminal domain-containing protein [unclassified Arthrobacter]MCC9146813.1 WHG domain-containing protein [Arthrobacter sp. zg-Y919]MDK1278044.1 TetR-like C-terminal domain-containing protein [Arthrobacter sp. zg.Y919]MDM7991542.1 TetR-like C-terminal domain-containing protein [Arthrobacter sp. zg-Y877]WIB03367.1 TetR-like C-terminal domain-containing protein [Arthrobacter sp. zg-Y919]